MDYHASDFPSPAFFVVVNMANEPSASNTLNGLSGYVLAAKAEGDEWVLDVLGLPLGTDRQGQTFTPSTNVDLSPGDEIPLYYHHGFEERAAKSIQRIGTAIYQGLDSAGHHFKAILDKASQKAQKIWADAVAGKAVRASTDSTTHLIRPVSVVGKPGTVTNWPIFALSLMDSDLADTAVNPRAVAVAAAKAYMQESEEADNVSGEAAKAGAAFAKRNRERLTAMKAMLDEMMQEFPDEPGSDMTGAAGKNEQVETKSLAAKADAAKADAANADAANGTLPRPTCWPCRPTNSKRSCAGSSCRRWQRRNQND